LADFLGPLSRLAGAVRDRQSRHRRSLEASKRLGRDAAAWAELFRRDDWKPSRAGHLGRCGHCGAAIDAALHRCSRCGAEWKANSRRGDLHRQIAAYAAVTALSVIAGYGCAAILRAHFATIAARGEFVNPEMVDTLASFLWLFCGVVVMIGFTYVIERVAPTGYWRKMSGDPGERRARRSRGADMRQAAPPRTKL
jgi:hypothetical protein